MPLVLYLYTPPTAAGRDAVDFENKAKELQQCVRPFFLRLTQDSNVADDAIEFALVQCWRHWPDRATTELKRLMITVGRRYYFSHREKEKNHENLLAHLWACSNPSRHSELPLTDRAYEDVRHGLTRIPSRWSEVLHRIYFDGQTNREVAAAMGRTLSAVKNWRKRGLDRLRRILERSSSN